jgi:hypothetical protein
MKVQFYIDLRPIGVWLGEEQSKSSQKKKAELVHWMSDKDVPNETV